MTYDRFEDLPVWNDAQELAVDIYVLLEDRAFDNKADLRDQLQRSQAAVGSQPLHRHDHGNEDDRWDRRVNPGEEVQKAALE